MISAQRIIGGKSRGRHPQDLYNFRDAGTGSCWPPDGLV
jgi:hypothetical protein